MIIIRRFDMKAFSLIELMVVIAIVSLLAAVAMPQYANYIKKAKLARAVSIVDANINNSIQYYNSNGVFPSAAQLGLPFDPGNSNRAMNSNGDPLFPGISDIVFGDNQVSGQCHFGSTISTLVANEDTESVEGVLLFNYFIDIDGVIERRCHYTYIRLVDLQPESISGDWIPGCANIIDNTTYQSETTSILNSCN